MAIMKFREKNRVKWMGVRPAHDGEQVTPAGSANNATVIVYTVPAGKTLYITHYAVQCTPNLAGSGYFAIRNELDVLTYRFQYLENIVGAPSLIESCSFVYPVEVPAGYDLYVNSNLLGFWVRVAAIGWIE